MNAALAMAESPAIQPDIRTQDVRGRTVLVRADLNVPMEGGRVTDPMRIVRFAPTVADLVRRGASVVVMSHLGRPGGVANPTLTLRPVAERLAAELGQRVIFVPDCVGAVAEQVTRTLPAGTVAMLENLRYHQEEERNDRSFALLLSVHGDFYVNDMPSPSGRSRQASIHALPGLMPAFAGPLFLAAQRAVPSHPNDTLEES
jgi:phosphoglycerate kinase